MRRCCGCFTARTMRGHMIVWWCKISDTRRGYVVLYGLQNPRRRTNVRSRSNANVEEENTRRKKYANLILPQRSTEASVSAYVKRVFSVAEKELSNAHCFMTCCSVFCVCSSAATARRSKAYSISSCGTANNTAPTNAIDIEHNIYPIYYITNPSMQTHTKSVDAQATSVLCSDVQVCSGVRGSGCPIDTPPETYKIDFVVCARSRVICTR